MPLSGHASTEGTERFAERMGGGRPGFYRLEQGLHISSIGIGTCGGKPGPATDAAYLSALGTAFRGGINLVDTAIIYRDQQSERLVGAAIGELIEQGHGQRDELVVCTKGGYLSPERSARRCTSSATTVNPRPASPADAAWIAAFSASTFVCSVMSEISSTISPISNADSPRRLMRFEVSWIC